MDNLIYMLLLMQIVSFDVDHRKIGEVGQKFGSSLILSHFKKLPNGSHVLNIANTGLGEAILLDSRRMVVLASPHIPSRSKEEIARITERAGFISEVRLPSPHVYVYQCTEM